MNEKTPEIEMQNLTLSNKKHIIINHNYYKIIIIIFLYHVQKFSSAVELWAWLIYNDAQRPFFSWWSD